MRPPDTWIYLSLVPLERSGGNPHRAIVEERIKRLPRPSQTRLRDDRWGYLATAGAVFAIAAFLIHEVYSLDAWWQVAIGRDILESLSIPRVDRYAAAALGRPYHDSHWLFQVVLALFHRAIGMVGVQLAMIAAWSAALAICWKSARRWVSAPLASLLLFLASMASVERFLPRPEILTFVGIAAFYYILQQGQHRRPGGLGLLSLIQILWANSHGLFVIGPFMVGCYWLAALTSRLRGPEPDFVPSSRALACVLGATLVTPFPFGGWRYAWLLFRESGGGGPDVMESLGELSETFGVAASSSPAFWFYLILLVLAVGLGLRSSWRRQFSPRLLIVAGLALASLTGRRNVVLFVLVAAPFVAEALGRPGFARPPARAWAIALAVLTAAYAVYPLSGAFYLQMEIPARWGFGVTPSFFPHGLPAYLERIGFRGQVLNSNTLGGFYLYHGYPERLPLTDGRWETYDAQELETVLADSRDGSSWEGLIPRYDIRGLLLAHSSPEASAILPTLGSTPGWRLVYLDQAASFWLSGGGADLPRAVDLQDARSLPPISRPDDGLILNEFLAAIRATELRVLNLERTLEFGVRSAFLLEQLGMLQIQTGRLDDAETTFEVLLQEQPGNVDALNELAFLAYNRGDLRRSAELMQRALRIEPENVELRQNYERVRDSLRRGTPDGN